MTAYKLFRTTHDTHTCYPEDVRTISMEEVLGIPKEKTNMSTVKVIARPTCVLSADSLNIGEYARIVNSQSKRRQAESIAASVPNVRQVVNELQVKNQKATSSH